ncbi:MAG: 30S ribosome-binding factor RbfA [Deltaproteobacteria bacterium]|jgi:ribosome-binding factor A|nr:30S ribosome-binding factor RbfA [Deltaproteobacteria bacterium]MBW2413971.1 30S ribosome-binding factor RbfA [Deltaproteobacteria bacterium]
MSHRKARAASDIRTKLASVIAERVRDPRLSGVSILEVRPSPDFSYARVFFRTLGDRAEAEAALDHAKPFLRRCLAEGSRSRRVPELDFRYDESPERAAHVEQILEELDLGPADADAELETSE